MTTYTFNRDDNIIHEKGKSFLEKIANHWFQIIVCLFILHIIFNKNVNIQVNLSDKSQTIENSAGIQKLPASLGNFDSSTNNFAQTASLKTDESASVFGSNNTPINPKWKSSDFRNLSFIMSPTLAERKGISPKIVEEKLEICRKYVERFATLAISEQKKFNIPASITLAQGLLESDAGMSRLSTESNNHFGIKCKSKCKGCTCRNYSDDDVFDMFRVFDTAWSSYREHSHLLNGKRYNHLKKLGINDYKGWARGLKKAGYATDKRYAEKLIQIIEMLDLYQFDR